MSVRRLWGIGTPRTLRPHWMLLELGLPYEWREVITRTASMQEPEFLALNQRSKIPVWEDDGLVIGESGAIVFTLADQYRDRGVLAPERGTRARAEFDDLCLFTLTEIDAVLYVIRRHEGLKSIYGESPVACQSAREYVGRGLAEIERRLADGRRHVLGEDFSAADILVTSCLLWCGAVEIPLPDRLLPYLDRIRERPAFGAAMARNFTPEAMAALAAQG